MFHRLQSIGYISYFRVVIFYDSLPRSYGERYSCLSIFLKRFNIEGASGCLNRARFKRMLDSILIWIFYVVYWFGSKFDFRFSLAFILGMIFLLRLW